MVFGCLAILVLVLTSCGGGDADDPSATERPTPTATPTTSPFANDSQNLKETFEDTLRTLSDGSTDLADLDDNISGKTPLPPHEGSPLEPVGEIEVREPSRVHPFAAICLFEDSVAPIVRITSPQHGATVLEGTSITMSAEAEDDQSEINWIEFFTNGARGVDETPFSPIQAQHGVDYVVPPGIATLTIEAIATDACGNTGTAPVQITVIQFLGP